MHAIAYDFGPIVITMASSFAESGISACAVTLNPGIFTNCNSIINTDGAHSFLRDSGTLISISDIQKTVPIFTPLLSLYPSEPHRDVFTDATEQFVHFHPAACNIFAISNIKCVGSGAGSIANAKDGFGKLVSDAIIFDCRSEDISRGAIRAVRSMIVSRCNLLVWWWNRSSPAIPATTKIGPIECTMLGQIRSRSYHGFLKYEKTGTIYSKTSPIITKSVQSSANVSRRSGSENDIDNVLDIWGDQLRREEATMKIALAAIAIGAAVVIARVVFYFLDRALDRARFFFFVTLAFAYFVLCARTISTILSRIPGGFGMLVLIRSAPCR